MSDHYILYTGKGKIGFKYNKDSSTLKLSRDDIEEISKEIVNSFPNSDSTMKIIKLNGTTYRYAENKSGQQPQKTIK